MSGTALVEIEGSARSFRPAVRSAAHGGCTPWTTSSFEVVAGEAFCLSPLGESGCGKSTLARCIVRLLEPSEGALRFDGADITHASMRSLRPLRRDIEAGVPGPHASLNPRKRIGTILEEALRLHGIGAGRDERRARVVELLQKVGLSRRELRGAPAERTVRRPAERVGIARALALSPKLIVADEPVSALDVSVTG